MALRRSDCQRSYWHCAIQVLCGPLRPLYAGRKQRQKKKLEKKAGQLEVWSNTIPLARQTEPLGPLLYQIHRGDRSFHLLSLKLSDLGIHVERADKNTLLFQNHSITKWGSDQNTQNNKCKINQSHSQYTNAIDMRALPQKMVSAKADISMNVSGYGKQTNDIPTVPSSLKIN